MSIKKLGLALAVSALASGANAALYTVSQDAGNTGGSSLLFAAYDAATTNTLFVDLNAVAANMRVHTFDRDGEPAQSIDLSSIAAANNFSLANVRWAIVGGDGAVAGGSCANANLSACGLTFMATVSVGETLPATGTFANIVNAVNGTQNNWFSLVSDGINNGNGHSTTIADGSSGQWTDIVPAQTFWNVSGVTGETLGFAVANNGSYAGSRGPVSNPNVTFAMQPGSWNLAGNSVLTYSAVPVPAALWMFASGLVGLAGVARRRKQA
jgi:hypothetical protein